MPHRFYDLKVKKIIRQTSDALCIYFDITTNLKSKFIFKAGQFITISHKINGKDVQRAYSIFTSPKETEFAVMVKEIKGGKLSPYINKHLKVGDTLKVMPPSGRFTHQASPEETKNYVFFAGGSGITPLFSIIKTILLGEKKSKLTLLYGNGDSKSIIFANELNILEKDFATFNLFHILEKPDQQNTTFNGLINAKGLGDLLQQMGVENVQATEFYTCGPGQMMKVVKEGLALLGTNSNKIHSESFTTEVGSQVGSQVGSGDAGIKGTAKLTLQIYGQEHEIQMKPDETVTAAAIRTKLDPPYSCQIGACSTCIAMLEKGKVEMDCSDALTQDEIDEGFVLTCTSRPTSEDIVINFDY